jgi:glycosyltransferase involved in cell wall biosynthesis
MSEGFEIFDNRDHNKQIEASVLVAVYNHEWCIELLLESLRKQSVQNFEIILIDDGSTDRTKEIAKKHPVFFITQEHKGFRKTRITNEASKYVKSNYIILLDGDCLPHTNYVKAHLDSREEGHYLAGRRVDIPRPLSEKYINLKKRPLIDTFLKINFWKMERPNRIFQCKSPFLRKLFKQNQLPDMMGCNGSFWLKDFINVDGYDERYVKAHREDGDLCVRLKNSGLKIKSVKGLALIYHLWHVQQPYFENEDLFNDTIENKRVKAVKGLSSR